MEYFLTTKVLVGVKLLFQEKLQEQLDQALDNLTEANEALHKSRKREQALKNQVQELALDKIDAHAQKDRAQKQAAQAHEAALKATQDAKDFEDRVHENRCEGNAQGTLRFVLA